MIHSNFSVKLENTDAIKRKLDSMPKEARKIVKGAVNDTAKQARSKLLKKAKESYTVKASSFNHKMNIKNATVKTLTAIISVEGRDIRLSSFKMVRNTYVKGPNKRWTGEAAKSQELKKSPLKTLISRKTGNKAFVTNVDAGGKSVPGIFWRKEKKGRKMTMLYGPSVPEMLRNTNVYDVVMPEVQKDFKSNVEKRMKKILSK